jgi:hypothetical protein
MTGFLTAEASGDDYLKIEPPRASLGELQLTNRLHMIPVERDVLGVAESLKRIDPGLSLLFDKVQEVFVLYHVGLDDRGHVKEYMVGAYKELDQRIVNLIRRIDGQGRGRYDLQRELERLEQQKDREEDHRQTEALGPAAEQLRWALRKDLGLDGSSVHLGGSRAGAKARRERRAKPKRRKGKR